MDKLEKLPPCPKLCRGEECSGIPCEEEEPGFSYSHIDDMVVYKDKAHVFMATRDGCSMFHLSPKKWPKPPPPAGPLAGHPAKNSGGGTSARGKPPRTAVGSHVTQERGWDPAPEAAAASRAAAVAVRPRPSEGD
jgi:hypothetical protein